MARRWTRRRDGSERTTIRVAVHVPRDLVEFLAEHDGMSEARALAWIRERVEHDGRILDGFHTVAIPPEGGAEVISMDDVSGYEADGYQVYEGVVI